MVQGGMVFSVRGFLVLELSTLYRQKAEDRTTADTNRQAEDKRFEAVLKQNQEDFEATMDSMGSVLSTQDKTLLETMGVPHTHSFCRFIQRWHRPAEWYFLSR